jgi:hypothetical protein
MNRRPIGNDINPPSILLTRPRLAPPTLDEVARELDQVLWDTGEIDDPELLVFYSQRTLRHISALRSLLIEQAPWGGDWIRMVRYQPIDRTLSRIFLRLHASS